MKIKRILSLILCVSLIAGAQITAFAENIPAETETAGESGIIDADYLKKVIEEYADANYMRSGKAEFSVGYYYTATGDSWYYNGDAWYYSASLYKVPVAMLLEEKELAGEISRDTVIESQYATDTVEQMEYKSIVYSNNYTGHAMVEYLGGSYNGKCSDQTIKFTSLPESYFDQNFFDVSYYSPRYYTEILKTVYENQDRFPHIIDYMKQANQYMCANPNDIGRYISNNGIGDKYVVAQKYGSYVEAQGKGDDNKHAAAIVYTPNPIIITIMTKNVVNYDKKIGDIASILVDYTLSLDSKIEEYKAEKIRLEKEAEEAAARKAEEEARIAAAEAAAEEARRQAQEEAARVKAEQERKAAVRQKIVKLACTIGGIILALAVVSVIAIKIKNSGGISKLAGGKKRKSYYDDDDFYEEEDSAPITASPIVRYPSPDRPAQRTSSGVQKKAVPEKKSSVRSVSVPSPAEAMSALSDLIPKKNGRIAEKLRRNDEDDLYRREYQDYAEENYNEPPEDTPAVRREVKNTAPAAKNTGKYVPKH